MMKQMILREWLSASVLAVLPTLVSQALCFYLLLPGTTAHWYATGIEVAVYIL